MPHHVSVTLSRYPRTQQHTAQLSCTALCIAGRADAGKRDTLRHGRDFAYERWRYRGARGTGAGLQDAADDCQAAGPHIRNCGSARQVHNYLHPTRRLQLTHSLPAGATKQ